MVEYIYFVKCVDCEDEPFNFFDEAKEFALNNMSKKPEIHQTEVVRNDFGVCTDSTDYGKVWSWEEMMSDIPEEDNAFNIFTKGDFAKYADGYSPDNDSEFDDRDITFETDCVVCEHPSDKTIKELVEEMEENEDVVECKWCDELFDKSDCRYEVNLGWLCPYCIEAIKSRGEVLTFREGSDLNEDLVSSFDPDDTIALDYKDLYVTIVTKEYPATYWEPADCEEKSYKTNFTHEVSADEVAALIWDVYLTEEDVADVEGGFDTLFDDKSAWYAFLDTHFDSLFKKYYDEILEFYKDEAREAAEKEEQEDFDNREPDYDEDERYFTYFESAAEPAGAENLLETLEEAEDYKKRLKMCPECGEDALDLETGVCINCGFVTLD